jgi:hypothetical protein
MDCHNATISTDIKLNSKLDKLSWRFIKKSPYRKTLGRPLLCVVKKFSSDNLFQKKILFETSVRRGEGREDKNQNEISQRNFSKDFSIPNFIKIR